ncbi:MAG: methyltransferase domain-containing protein [Anaerolineales bacterium]|nr:methyltransferase domain-containing protein [Anaerolineales bacterium]
MTKKRPFKNRLNDLTPKKWLQFQKSWFIHNPPPRKKDVLRHPAKFPETLVQEFVEFFTKRRQLVLDPMVGTGSTLIACLRAGRNSVGIELNPTYAEIARQLVTEERTALGEAADELRCEVINGDADRLEEFDLPSFDYIITSPPYWNMLHTRGAETQRKRRASQKLDIVYSDDPADVGNIEDYDEFLDALVSIYSKLKPYLRPRAYMTIIVKNVKKGGRIYPLAWDLAQRLREIYTLKDEKVWCQDDIRLAPYGLGNAWVSNTFHHYCLQFRNESDL